MRLHLGCGKKFINGFIHIDAIDYHHIDHVATIDNLSFIQDNTVELILGRVSMSFSKLKNTLREGHYV